MSIVQWTWFVNMRLSRLILRLTLIFFDEDVRANGADIKLVSLADVLLTWEPKLIQFFLDHGAHAVAGKPFAEAFGQRSERRFAPLSDISVHTMNSQPNYGSNSIALYIISAAREI